MPKILINEKDMTSPGLPDSYANFSVLVAGLMGTPSGEEANRTKPDSNGIYEFTSAQSFKETIGLKDPIFTTNVVIGDTSSENVELQHYGNQMAYELLNLGYSIVYAPFEKVSELATETFWEKFKDKASYDFRFITHGLLASVNEPETYTEATERKKVVDEAQTALTDVNNAYEIDSKAANENASKSKAKSGLEEVKSKQERYEEIMNSKAGFKAVGSDTPYPTYDEAVLAVNNELTSLATVINNFDVVLVTNRLLNDTNLAIANLATYKVEELETVIPGRGDCVALIELDESRYDSGSEKPEIRIINAINEIGTISDENGKYCAMTVPSVSYKISDEVKKFPGGFHYLACFINSLKQGFAEWYAAAGYTRGVSSFTIDSTTVKLGEIAINALEPRYKITNAPAGTVQPTFACNVIANFRGSYYLWGNRTAYNLGTKGDLKKGDLVASHFLNIRQLCTTIKKQLYVACRSFTFDPNSDTLWFNFVNAIRPTLDAMKADQGIRDYKISKVYTDKKATLKAKIRIIPIEAVEDFDLEISLEDSFGETTAVVNE